MTLKVLPVEHSIR